jgi:arginase family enzyme
VEIRASNARRMSDRRTVLRNRQLLRPLNTSQSSSGIVGSSLRTALIGVPWDRSSSFMRGAAGAPARIREALWSDSSNPWSERGVDVSVPGLLEDSGDITVGDEPGEAREAIEAGIGRLLDQGICPIALGGDHSVTYPIVRAYRGRVNGLTIVHVDAHTDLYDEFQGDRYSHACPFARILRRDSRSDWCRSGLEQHRAISASRRRDLA